MKEIMGEVTKDRVKPVKVMVNYDNYPEVLVDKGEYQEYIKKDKLMYSLDGFEGELNRTIYTRRQ